jgi:hypothetical protein
MGSRKWMQWTSAADDRMRPEHDSRSSFEGASVSELSAVSVDELRALQPAIPHRPRIEEMRAVLQRITYKPNIRLWIGEHPIFQEGEHDGFDHSYRLCVEMIQQDARSASPRLRPFRSYWQQSWPSSLEIFVFQVHTALIEIEKHEASEWFRLNGELVFDPHGAGDSFDPHTAAGSFAFDAIRTALAKPVAVDGTPFINTPPSWLVTFKP